MSAPWAPQALWGLQDFQGPQERLVPLVPKEHHRWALRGPQALLDLQEPQVRRELTGPTAWMALRVPRVLKDRPGPPAPLGTH
jgi:hypothetical protein